MKQRIQVYKTLVSTFTLVGVLLSTPSIKSSKENNTATETAQYTIAASVPPKDSEPFKKIFDSKDLITGKHTAKLNIGIQNPINLPTFVREEPVQESPVPVEMISSIMENETIYSFFTDEEVEEILIQMFEINPEILKDESNIDIIIQEIINEINEQKVTYILEKYGLTRDQFEVVVAICLAEAARNYDDRYNVTSTMLNRIHSIKWIYSISDFWKEDVGTSLYYQAITPSQFVVYENGSYKEFLGCSLTEAQAVIDCLYSGIPSHNFLSFKAYEVQGSVRLSKGNYYHNPQSESDIYVEPEIVLPKEKVVAIKPLNPSESFQLES